MWILNCKRPDPANAPFGWPWPPEYFPRKIRYKKDAERIKEAAIKRGATNVTLKKG